MEAINCANYIVNFTPIKDLKDITLEYIILEGTLSKNKLDIIHLCFFVIEASTHIHKEKQKSLHTKSEKCIFGGYSKDVKGHRLL